VNPCVRVAPVRWDEGLIGHAEVAVADRELVGAQPQVRCLSEVQIGKVALAIGCPAAAEVVGGTSGPPDGRSSTVTCALHGVSDGQISRVSNNWALPLHGQHGPVGEASLHATIRHNGEMLIMGPKP
jgi:hypothetical protein